MDRMKEMIRRKFKESRKDETTFDYDDSEYEHYFGKYTRNRVPISKEEYHAALKNVIKKHYQKGSIAYNLSLPSKEFATKVEEFQDFIDSLVYDKEYETVREKRGHLDRFDKYDEDGRVSQIMKDTGLSEEDAKRANDIIMEYTSTNMYTKFTPEEEELLDKFLDSSPIFYPPPVYRGLGFRKKLGDESLSGYVDFSKIEEGDTMTFMGYASFSSDPDIAIEFANVHGDYQVYIVNTKNLSGVSVDHLSPLDYAEEELLYKKDAAMLVKSKVVKDKTIYFHVEEISLMEGEEDRVIEVPILGKMNIKD